MHRQDADGASAVEFALVFPLLAMLMFGMITAGLALNRQQQINHAAREGSRFGATLEDLPSAPAFQSVANRIRDAAVGQLNEPPSYICVMFVDEGVADGPHWYNATTSPPTAIGPPAGYACTDQLGSSDGEYVQVAVFTPARIEAIFFRSSFTMSASAVSNYEPRPEPSP